MDVGALEVAIVAAALVAAAWIATKELAAKRQTDSLANFLDLVATVDGRPRDGRSEVSSAEQLAALWLIAELGTQHKWLRTSAREALTGFSKYDSATPEHAAIATVAQHALNTVPR